jgi:cytochrome c556
MNCERSISIIIVVGVFGVCFVGNSAMGQTEPQGGMNVLRREMLALEEAFETIIDAVIFDNMQLIEPFMPPFHIAREKFDEAMSTGQKIELPKNQDRFEEFVKLDNKFRRKFEVLEKAAEAGKKKVVKDQIHELFDACVVCHERFRK